MRRSLINKLNRQHSSGPRRFAVAVKGVVYHGKAITLAQIPVKVDVRRENVHNLQGNAFGTPALSTAANNELFITPDFIWTEFPVRQAARSP